VPVKVSLSEDDSWPYGTEKNLLFFPSLGRKPTTDRHGPHSAEGDPRQNQREMIPRLSAAGGTKKTSGCLCTIDIKCAAGREAGRAARTVARELEKREGRGPPPPLTERAATTI